MNQFLNSFTDECIVLANQGLNWKDPETNEEKNTQIFVSGLTADSPAKAKVLKMKGPSGYDACVKCRHPGKSTKCTIKKIKFVRYPTGRVYKIRKHKKVLRDMKKAYKNNKYNNNIKLFDVNGFFGVSVLLGLPKFRLPRNICVDAMHCIDLGICRKLFFMYTESVGKNYYIGKKTTIKLIDERVLSIKRTINSSRDTRSLTEAKIWKATEWSLWLFFDSFVVLENILPDEYLKNLALLSSAIYLLSQDLVTGADVNIADGLIEEFLNNYQVLFKKEHCVYNLHSITHIVQNVIDFGPLFCSSCEMYESANSDVGKLVTGPAHIPQ
jgi:hypothetical protein